MVMRKKQEEEVSKEEVCIFISIRLGVLIGEVADKYKIAKDQAKNLILATAEIINKYK